MNGDLHQDQQIVTGSATSSHVVEPQALNLVSTTKAAQAGNAQVNS